MKKNKKQQEPPLTQQDLIDFTLGRRAPVTKKQKELQKEIDAIKKAGRIVDIPNEWP